MAVTSDEIGHAFEWDRGLALQGPSRLLLERFRPPAAPPPPIPSQPISKTTRSVPKRRKATALSEGLWMRTAFIYSDFHNRKVISEYFLNTATEEFGAEAINVSTRQDVVGAAKKWWRDYIPAPSVIGPSDFYVAGMMHLQDVWRGNTFSASTTHKGDFVLRSSEHETVDMMPSALSGYRHAQTDSFEAVILPCWSVYLLVILPAEGKDILQLESHLMNDPAALDNALKPEVGDVELPRLRFQSETDLGPSLQRMGVRQVFKNLDLVNIPNSHLKQVAQKVDLEINEQGIRANAGTVVNGIYGGVGGGIVPFHMKVNRPFLFLIRDHLTNSLVFLGAVMDPAAH